MDFAAFDHGQTPTIALINKATIPFAQWKCGPSPEAFLAALQKFANLFATYWGTPCKLVLSKEPVAGAWSILFTDTADVQGALGYHDVGPNGLPLQHIFVGTTLKAGDSVSVTTSHELAEALADPGIQLAAYTPKGNFVALETADAVERLTFPIDGISMTDFVFPSYFEGFRKPGSDQFDYLKKVDRPFLILPGGYLPVYKPGQGWTQIFGSKDAEDRYNATDRRGHRAWKRQRKWTAQVAAAVETEGL